MTLPTDLLSALKCPDRSEPSAEDAIASLVILREELASARNMTVKQLVAWAERGEDKRKSIKDIREAVEKASIRSHNSLASTAATAHKAALWFTALVVVAAMVNACLASPISTDIVRAAGPVLVGIVWLELVGAGLALVMQRRAKVRK